jgi:hypothetical protein
MASDRQQSSDPLMDREVELERLQSENRRLRQELSDFGAAIQAPRVWDPSIVQRFSMRSWSGAEDTRVRKSVRLTGFN